MFLEAEFYHAVKTGDVVLVSRMIKEHPELLALPCPMGGVYLNDAADISTPEVLRLFASVGLQVDARDNDQETPLFRACRWGRMDNAKTLIELGADVNAASKSGCTPLIAACLQGHLDVVKLLIQHGARLDALYFTDRWRTAVQAARLYEHPDIADYLLSLGAPAEPPPGLPRPAHRKDEYTEHVEDNLGQFSELALNEIVGDLRIQVIKPWETGAWLTLVTDGVRRFELSTPPGSEAYSHAELVMNLPGTWPLDTASLAQPRYYWPIMLLRSLAHMAEQDGFWYGDMPVIVSNGDPPQAYDDSTKLCCALLLRDTSLPAFESDDCPRVTFYTVMPLYREERDYEKAQGLAALEQHFRKNKIDLLTDPQRPNALSVPPANGTRR